MLSIKLVDWAAQGISRLSSNTILLCISVKDLVGGVDWFIWRSHAEFYQLCISLGIHTELFPMPCSEMQEILSPLHLLADLENWLMCVCSVSLVDKQQLLRNFLTSNANVAPSKFISKHFTRRGSIHSAEYLCIPASHEVEDIEEFLGSNLTMISSEFDDDEFESTETFLENHAVHINDFLDKNFGKNR